MTPDLPPQGEHEKDIRYLDPRSTLADFDTLLIGEDDVAVDIFMDHIRIAVSQYEPYSQNPHDIKTLAVALELKEKPESGTDLDTYRMNDSIVNRNPRVVCMKLIELICADERLPESARVLLVDQKNQHESLETENFNQLCAASEMVEQTHILHPMQHIVDDLEDNIELAREQIRQAARDPDADLDDFIATLEEGAAMIEDPTERAKEKALYKVLPDDVHDEHLDALEEKCEVYLRLLELLQRTYNKECDKKVLALASIKT